MPRRPRTFGLVAVAVAALLTACTKDNPVWGLTDSGEASASSGGTMTSAGPGATSDTAGTLGVTSNTTTSGSTGHCATGWNGPLGTLESRVVVGIDSLPEAADDFPVSVRITDLGLLADTDPFGDGVVAIAPDGTRLPHEVEIWDPGEPLGIVWVRLPSVGGANSTFDSFALYFGPNADSIPPPAGGVWDNGFAGVWHMRSDCLDSVGVADCLSPGALSPEVGAIGAALPFDGSQFIAIPGTPEIANVFRGGGTISAWIRAESFGGSDYGRIADKATVADGSDGWAFELANADAASESFRFEHGFSGERSGHNANSASLQDVVGDGSPGSGTWTHLAVTYFADDPSNEPTFYINGNRVAGYDTMPEPAGTAVDDSLNDLYLGGSGDVGGVGFFGAIDEVRLSNVARSEDWLELEHRSGSDALLFVGDVELNPCL